MEKSTNHDTNTDSIIYAREPHPSDYPPPVKQEIPSVEVLLWLPYFCEIICEDGEK